MPFKIISQQNRVSDDSSVGFLYTRSASTPGDGQDKSIERQISNTRKLAAYCELQVDGEFQDAGFSSHNFQRPGLQQLIAACNGSDSEIYIVVESFDRLFRGSADYEQFWEMVDNVNICSCE